MTRPSVVIIGPCADPTDVGEALSTWRWTSGLSEHADITLLTYVKSGRQSAATSLPGVRVVEWGDLPVPDRLERFNAALAPGYGLFYFRARRWLRRALARGERIDLVHQLAPLAPRYPTPAAGLGVPVVVGPLAGSLETPPGFAAETSVEPWYVKLRRLDGFRIRHDLLLRRTFESAAVVIGVAPYVRDVLGDLELREFMLESETGIPELPPPVVRDFGARPFRLLFVGRVVRPKGVRDLVRGLSRVEDLDVVADVVGRGNDLEACRVEASQLGVADRVHFHGRLPRQEVDGFYESAHAFVFPSFREPSGNVVLEAMSWGLPMIVADRGGPAYAVGDGAGIRVPVETPGQFAEAIGDAIRQLVASPQLAREYGDTARRLTERDHLWPAKIDRVARLYERVIAGR